MANKKIDKQIERYQRDLIDTHYQEVENMYKKMRGWRHDYRNHIQTMKVLAEKGNLEAIKEYLNKLDEDLATVDTVVKTGNAMADAILNSKISLAKSKGINVKVDAHVPVKLKMSELDLCVILGNLFDNAIEATSGQKDAWIKLNVKQYNDTLYIGMENTILYKPKDNLKTTKMDTKCHGYGLDSIKKIAKKYEGDMVIDYDDKTFRVEVVVMNVIYHKDSL